MNNSTCFFYHRTNRYNVTIAYERTPGGVRYGAAFCRPEDQFVKRRGREIARGRMNTVAEPITLNSKTCARWEVHEVILSSLELGDYGYTPDNFRA